MTILLAPFRIAYCLYAFTLFIVIMLCVTPIVLAASFFGKIKGGNFIYKVCSLWADTWYLFIGIFHKNIYEGPHNRHKQYIFVANHISYLDAPVIVKSIRQPVRVLGKVEFSEVPVFGYIYKNAIVTVDRSSALNRGNSVRILKSVLKRNISIFIFPEGTFNETSYPLKNFFDGAFRMAIETQTPIKPLLFLNTYDRMHYKSVFSMNPGRSATIFMDEIPVAGLTYKDVAALKQKVYDAMEAKLIEHKAGWIKYTRS
jgi:1-acyl-sn-glycerol-3-phosphate acyltransferase